MTTMKAMYNFFYERLFLHFFSQISSVKKECGDKTEEVEGDSLAYALEDDRSTPQHISLGNHLTEESKREDVSFFPICPECPHYVGFRQYN